MLRFIPVVAMLVFAAAGSTDASAKVNQPNTLLPDDVGPGMFVTEFEVPAYIGVDEARRCVVNGLVARHWLIHEQSDGRVVGYLNHRAYEARTTFLIDDLKVRVYCVGYVVSRKGERLKPHIPVNWIKFVTQDIRIGFGVDPDTGGDIAEMKLSRLRTDLDQRVSNSPSRADAG